VDKAPRTATSSSDGWSSGIRHSCRSATSIEDADAKELDRLLADLDDALSDGEADDEVTNLIWVSFVENAQGVSGEDEDALRRQLRRYPHLASALAHYE